MPSSITLLSSPTRTPIRCRLKLFTSCVFVWQTLAPDFVINWIELRAVRGHKSGSSSYGSLTFCTSGLKAANDAQNVRVDTTPGKVNNLQKLSKMMISQCI